MNFCDPTTYREPNFLSRVLALQSPVGGSGWKLALGIHPKHATTYTEEDWGTFVALLQNPLVVGMSEVGFDFSVPSQRWPDQEALFLRLLGQGTQGRVLILHLRGGAHADTSYAVHKLSRRLLTRQCSPLQRIHLHCYNSDEVQVKAWAIAFPHCYFGFTGLARHFNASQVRGLRAVAADRVVLETDSPHLPPHPGMGDNSPDFLGDVGAIVADLRGLPLADLMRQTVRNGQALYGIFG
ncbi:uncharacterized protein LOC105441457 [Strongylocentrotus purpuratus]|uniref:Uncharacterized protein n=1 Tax=Strongylocentrotus purpuratus TaxID=7668 RepID=A0A7M7HM64_STRPU|nr:uncharacterized protein LOC105441457 [Strongylocentrotus purpuratus]